MFPLNTHRLPRLGSVTLAVGLLAAPATTLLLPSALCAQAAPANSSQAGTVKSVASGSIVVTTAKGDVTVTPATGARLLQNPPGATDLKSARPIALTDISPGDKVLVTGPAGSDSTALSAVRIILIKAAALADLHASQSADWQRRGTGGIVKTVSAHDLTVASGARTLTVVTTPATIYRRYAGDSVKFEDARPGTLADIQAGDQMRVRGDRNADGTTITAEEIVSGSFENLAGVVSAVDATAGTVTLKDLATKKNVTVTVTANSNLRHLSPEMAAAYARRQGAAANPSATPASAPAPAASGDRPRYGGGAGGGAGQGGGRGGADLSQMLQRLPTETLAELKPGQAVLIVASQTGSGATAITMLSGVEAILTASPGGAAPQLSPWNLGGGAGGEGGEAGAGGGPGGR